MVSSALLILGLVAASAHAAIPDLAQKAKAVVTDAKGSQEQTLTADDELNMKRKTLLRILEDASCDGSVG